jgi:hypothetical protein
VLTVVKLHYKVVIAKFILKFPKHPQLASQELNLHQKLSKSMLYLTQKERVVGMPLHWQLEITWLRLPLY